MRYKKFLLLPIASLSILPIVSITSVIIQSTILVENQNINQVNKTELFNNSYDYEKLKSSFLKDLSNITNSNFVSSNLSNKVEIPICCWKVEMSHN